MRRFHNKSKSGCKQCKARRIKCDEAHPVCRRCSHANLDCSFQGPSAAKTSSFGPETNGSVKRNPAEWPSSGFQALPVNTSPQDSSSPQSSVSASEERFTSLDLRLLYHFEHDFYQHEKAMHPGLDDLLRLYIGNAWTTPYLMDEVLAYAAAHRSTLDGVDRGMCLAEAKRLQTRALTQYNCERSSLTEDTCLPMFLFSGLLSHHIIFEARLAAEESLESAVDALTYSVGIHRGLIIIAREAWPTFSEEDQNKFIRSCQRDYMPLPSGSMTRSECDALLTRLDMADSDQSCKSIYRAAVEALQDRFDAVSLRDTHSMWAAIQDWLAAISPGYVDLLQQMRPEALVILAHFAVLLHYVSEHWFVSDLGIRLVRLIDGYLGAPWRKTGWLEWPIRQTLVTPTLQL